MLKSFRGILVGIFSCVLLALTACGGPPIPLTGTVLDSYSGQPISAANIKLGETSFATDSSGRYQIERWSTRDTLQISADGYEVTSIALETQPQLAQPTPPTVTFDAKLRPNTLTGLITDGYTEKPLANVTLSVGEQQVTTTADGRYTLRDLPEAFEVKVAVAGYEALTQAFNRQTVANMALRPNTLTGLVTDQYTGKPVAGATVNAGDAQATTGADGRYQLENVAERATLMIKAEGYAELTQPIERVTSVDAVIRPDVLKAQLVDGDTGKPIQHATIIATQQLNTIAIAYQRMDDSSDGQFSLQGIPEQGYLQVLSPGYRKAVVELKPGAIPDVIKLEPFQAKALYVTAPMAAKDSAYQSYLDALDRTELNALVIDLKSDLFFDLGLIYYDSQVPIVKELNTSRPIMDLEKILAEAKKRNIYTIARIHIFSHDNVLAQAKPEWAGRDDQGRILASRPTSTINYDWLDPWNRNVWDYNIQLGVEAALMGFDEINFDYIRFPDIDPKKYRFSKPTDPVNDPEAMFKNITEFAKVSQEQIHKAGAFFSVDVFGYAALRPMWEIGQNIEMLAPYTDYIMPMTYPSHYSFGEFGFDDPATKPYEVIEFSMKKGWTFVEGKRARLRPWLQDFTLIWRSPIVRYGVPEIRAQIDATESFEQHAGWAMWDPDATYDEEAFKVEP
jgi:hypothetical protein